jgi:glucose-1-phosphate cytidylyltransferase
LKVVIFAGGYGTRLSEETVVKPKPLVEIGGAPILWHIMNWYSFYGHNEFIICGGYKCEILREYFVNLMDSSDDFQLNFATKKSQKMARSKGSSNWNVIVANTGDTTQTGGRLLKIRKYLKQGENFLLTYGDGLSDVDINATIDFHNHMNRLVTMTCVHPIPRFGSVEVLNNTVKKFSEKAVASEDWINGGFFVVNERAIDFVDSFETPWESTPLSKLANSNEIAAFLHEGFWHPMDTLNDKRLLNSLWDKKQAPWVIKDKSK